ncbi:SUN domain-containing protein 2-like [Pungitius pungitius]|uniref:SUN domain-containing protein 2-like n=1 Tax=Pungitius pungitius TaxID=134920 RepID=UPI002E161C4E
MSRRSLRLDEGLLDRSIPRGSASFSVGGASWRSNRSSRRSHLSASCSESLLVGSPRRALVPPLLSSSVASDASLLSSLLDDSVQESTLVDTFWGLDQEFDSKDATVLLNQRPVDAVLRCPKHLLHSHGPLHCGQCELQAAGAEASTIYGRDRSRRSTADVLQMWLRPFRLCVSRAAAGCGRVLAHTWQVCEELFSQDGHGAAPGLCGVMDLKESTSTQKELHPDGSLCESSGTKAGPLVCPFDVCLLLLSPGVSSGDSAGDRRRTNRRWSHMTSSFLLTGSAVLLLLLLSLCWFGPALQSVNVTEWTHSPPAGGAGQSGEVLTDSREELIEREASLRSVGDVSPGDVSPGDGSVRLLRLEEGLVALGERVEAGGREAERRHEEVLQLYEELRLLVSDQSRREEAEPWMRNLMEQKLEQLSRGLEDRRQTEKSLQKDSLQSQKTRLDELELKLQEEQWRREADSSSSSSSSSSLAADGMSHDALLSEVAQLAAALQDVRRHVEGLSGCEESCRRLDGIQQAISAQVREEVRLLFYGNQLSVVDGAPPPEEGPALQEPLVQRYVSTDDLQAALLALELRLLQNVSRQLEGHRGGEDSALTPEDVEDIVADALRLFSQDRTGLADFALESGGGSILTARCSETFQTKAALLSLFGLPLWYFSQSPRAVIQPDVHPGNCWAFRGSKGFLVIRLSMKILPTAFSMEHIDRALTPSGSLESAPRDFTVYGLKEEEEDKEKKLLGSFTFDSEGEPLQTYHVTEENHEAFQLIEVQVLSNWGHQEYTCMYRFRVHGTPRPT